MASADLPEDRIVKEILIRVPVKSMVRFRCVCKLWNSLVSNPDFTRSQSNLSVSNNFDDDHIILNKRLPDSNLSIISRATLSETRINKVPYPAAIHADMHLVGSINGLVCVVCLSSLAVAYSCKTDSWSNVAVRWTRYWKDARWSPSVIVKGIPYWNQSDEIIKFDAKINEFTYFSVPKRHVHYTLIDLNGCLGWIGYIRLGQYAFQLPDVYCFDEKNRIWSKRYIINIIACLSCEPLSYPICFKYGGEIIFDERNILYDLKSGEIKRLCDPSVYLNGFSYTPSFLSLEGMEPFQEEALEDWVVSKYQITFVMKRLLESRVGAMAENGKVKIDKFDDKDYGFWKMQIQDYLNQKKIHIPLEEKKPTSMKDEDWKLLDRQALEVVRLTLAKNVAYNIVKETTSYGLIKTLSNMYKKLSASNKIGRKLENGQNKGHSRSKSQKRGQSKDRKDIVCWNCQKNGHFRNQCTAPAAPKGKSIKDNSANVVEEVVDDDALICSVECSVESWIMDSGASFHANPCKDLMLNFRVGIFGQVRLADDETLDIAGMGDINLRTSLGTS
ncbi:hypothetical protein AgCh_027259 [Apium graveolens]